MINIEITRDMLLFKKIKNIPLSQLLLLAIIVSFSLQVNAQIQPERKLLRQGNKMYQQKKYNEAEILYRKGLEKDKSSDIGAFNLGDALYQQQKYDEATEQFKKVIDSKTDKSTLSKAYHNLGNSLLESKKYEESIKAFKNALINESKDGDTKYNLAYAQSMLKKQQEQQKQNKDNKDKKDDKKDKNKDKNKDKKDDKKNEDKKDQDKKDDKQKQDQQKQQQQQPKISKEDAQRMLDALNNREKDLQKKLGKKEAVKVSVEKDW